MKTSDQINEFAKAMSAAQGQIKNPTKGSVNPHFKNRYADLADGIEAVRDALAANGLCVVQSTYMDGDLMMLETRIAHESGQWIASDWPVCKFPVVQQVAGSAMTYSRRYSLFALVGIAGDDDDGNDASKSETPAPSKKPIQVQPNISHISDDQFNELVLTGDARAEAGTTALKAFWKGLNEAERNDLGQDRLTEWKKIAAVKDGILDLQKEAA